MARRLLPRMQDARSRRLLGRLLAILVIAFVVSAALGRWAVVRRSSEASITIVATLPQLGSSYEQSPTGTTIRYTFQAGGRVFAGSAFRPWLDVSEQHPKVCFAPENPEDHLLVEGDYRCGV